MTDISSLRGVMFLWPGYWLLVSAGLANRPHRHVAASLLCGLDGPLHLEVEGRSLRADAALVAPEVEQSLATGGGRALVVHLDPDQPLWRPFIPLAQETGVRTLERSLLDLEVLERAVADEDAALAHQWLASLAGKMPPARPLDSRVQRVAQWLRAEVPERVDMNHLGALVGLSPSRLTHLFREETGVTLRRFLLHLKVERALHCWQPGMTVAEVASRAGFYDQPHLVRTVREMFDALPSVLLAAAGLRLIPGGAAPDQRRRN